MRGGSGVGQWGIGFDCGSSTWRDLVFDDYVAW